MARQAAYNREAVLEKARQIFWAQGFKGTSMKDLEHGLDMRPGSLYAAFESKENLFIETLSLYSQRSRQAFDDAVQNAATPLQGIADYVRSFVAPNRVGAPSRACMLVKTVLETPDDDPLLRRKAEELLGSAEAMFARAFERAKAVGELPPEADPERLARRLQTEIFGLGVYAQRVDRAEIIAELGEDLAQGVLSLGQAPANMP